MASTSTSQVVPVSPAHVWRLIGGFGSLPDWIPTIPDCVLLEGGRVRRLTTSQGEVVVERLLAFDAQQRSYSYTLDASPFPVTGYLSTLRVHEVPGAKDAAEVQWSGRFVPQGVEDDDVIALFTGIYRDGLDGLLKALSG
ncbi:SRPBCC family protein [Streptomyces sp. MI02-7b]|uniref:SRPBCC family protein n=1 Tax=Streptomyces sp. MI02-7b TaxID=462941 RepID=UPI0029B616E7|nr:SRPBCC family protein [Streptomyces sp. MI02-7b]MDX3076872.1 SRPBCC family protein [Streptomyces sp. MI02-7b]